MSVNEFVELMVWVLSFQ